MFRLSFVWLNQIEILKTNKSRKSTESDHCKWDDFRVIIYGHGEIIGRELYFTRSNLCVRRRTLGHNRFTSPVRGELQMIEPEKGFSSS